MGMLGDEAETEQIHLSEQSQRGRADDSEATRIEAQVRRRLFVGPSLARRFGRYLVLEQIGEGGMSTIYAAYDEQLDRKIAIKVLREDELGDSDERARLLREAQALARLSHPNVITVHEVAEHDGELFLAMEFIRGRSLADWLSTNPAWPAILATFVQAGRGLAAAHTSNLVHRDFKPHNVMRADDDSVKVLDFGLAYVRSEPSLESSELSVSASLSASLTIPGTVMGTPAYMAPEQHTGETADARADQYAFCVALWEALSGSRPFMATDFQALYAAKREGPPPWPAPAPAIPRTVVDALERGLSPDPGERWPSMEALLEALSWDPRRRRNRLLLGLTVASVLGLGATTFHTWTRAEASIPPCSGASEQLVGVWDDERRTAVRTAILAIDRAYATKAWQRTEQELDHYAEAWAQVYTEACEATAVRRVQSPRMLDLRMGCLRQAAVDMGAAVDTLSKADAKVVDRAHVLTGELRPLSRCTDIEALNAEVEPPLPSEADAVEAARLQLARAQSQYRAGRYDDASEALLAAKNELIGIEYGPIRTDMALLEGTVLDGHGKYDEAEASLREAITLASRWRQWDRLFEAALELMFVVGNGQQRPKDALQHWPLVEGLYYDDPDREAKARDRHGMILRADAQYEESEAEHRAAVALIEGLPGSVGLDVARLRNGLANVLILQGKHAEAEAEYREVLATLEETIGPDHPDVATTRHNLGHVLQSRGEYEEAAAEFRAAYRLRVDAMGPDNPEVAKSRNGLAITLYFQGRAEEAEAEFRAALAIWEKALGTDNPNILPFWFNLGNVLIERGKPEEGEVELRRALVLASDSLGPKHPMALKSRLGLARALQAQRRYQEAEAEFRESLAGHMEVLGTENLDTAKANHDLATMLLELDRSAEALPLAEEAWSRRQNADAKPEDRAASAFLLARILWTVPAPDRDLARALRLAEDAHRSYEEAGADDDSIRELERWRDDHQTP